MYIRQIFGEWQPIEILMNHKRFFNSRVNFEDDGMKWGCNVVVAYVVGILVGILKRKSFE